MSEPESFDYEPPTVLLEPERPRGRAWIAWVIIVVLVSLNIYLHIDPPAVAVDDSRETRIDFLLAQVQSRYLVGAADLVKQSGQSLAAQAEQLDVGSPGQRLRAIVVIGELSGPTVARTRLSGLNALLKEHFIELDPKEKRVYRILRRVYTDYARERWNAPSVNEGDRTFLRDELGWFGELALAPEKCPDTAARAEIMHAAHITAIAFLFGAIALLVLGLAGTVGLILLGVLLASRTIRGGLSSRSDHGGIYAQTFAIWMILFMVLNIGAVFAPVPAESRMLILGLAILLSLAALGWPVLRGIPWEQVRAEIGLTTGRRPVLEPVVGVAVYAMALPLLLIGLLMTLFLIVVTALAHQGALTDNPFAPTSLPTHPIIEVLGRPGWWGRIQVFFVASFVAPVVEETMFRGVLYRHLRDASFKLGAVVSFLFSGLVVNFIFAAIHPQGLVAVPALMGLAFALTIAREWRETLIPSMVAHGISNGILLGLFMLAVST